MMNVKPFNYITLLVERIFNHRLRNPHGDFLRACRVRECPRGHQRDGDKHLRTMIMLFSTAS